MSIFDEIRDHKSRADFEGAWQVGYPTFEQDAGNTFLQTSLFWVIYAELKKLLEPFKTRDNKTPHPNEQRLIDLWASRILLLQLELPNELIDYRLWSLFRETGKFCDPICLFILQRGSSLFSPDDHNPFSTDKGESPSVVLRLARMVAVNYLHKGLDSPLPVSRVVAFLKYALDKAEDSPQGKIWLEYDKARIFVTAGDIVRARDAYLSVLRNKRGESWAWFGLAKTYENEPEKAICLVSFGLTCAHDPKFSIPGLVRLAELLAQTGVYDYASKALIKLTKIYSDNGWALKDSIVELTSSAWFDASLDTSDLDAHVEELAIGANKYAMAKPTYLSGVLLSVHESGKGATIYIHRDLKFSARKAVFENRKIPKPGTLVKIFCDMGSERQDVVSVENIQVIETQDIRSFKGSLKVSEKGFGFVNGDIFVPPGLVEGVQRDAEVAGAAVMSFDKTKSKYGWKAITLFKEVGSPNSAKLGQLQGQP
ncbi:hypothetical protein HBO14_03015 [Pseudomonas sp. WS 5406]|uniref:TOTE conflict systems S1/CSD-like domain-containing protein n=1 Tax=Pseudomonas haemolytica TaxID=2600065 RepID=A0A5P1D915_9PSED|nr:MULTISPECIES: hypothetical protein [Pseudomonas]MRJ36973.1 hypothetical protein [Pseudomonas haemolytica]NMX25492.1 hypothetical protein [Pseudomonas sp. WS 5406]